MTRPWISTNLAISADGKISSENHRPSNWTSATDHARLLEFRKHADALLVGRGTLDADQMTMTVPGKTTKQPLRCVASRSGKFTRNHPLFSSAGGAIHLWIAENNGEKPTAGLATAEQTLLVDDEYLEASGVTQHGGSLADFLSQLAEHHGVKHLHCEGGGELIRSLAALDAIDEFHITLAGHTIFGGARAPTASGIPCEYLPESLDFTLHHFEPSPETSECFLSYRRTRALA